jgi:preprotein translocase subunit SecY
VSFFGILLLAIIVLVAVSSIVFFQEAQRRIPVQYSRTQFRGGRQYRQQGSTHIPLRLLSAGMIPIIFAYSIMLVPSFMGETLATSTGGFSNDVGNLLTDVFGAQNAPYYFVVFLFVVLFTYFYTLVTYSQQNLAENLQKQGGFIPGIRPGKNTAEYLDYVLTRLTVVGSAYLAAVCLLPEILVSQYSVPFYFGGTSLLIVVTVTMDTVAQIQSHLLAHQYEGLIKKSRLKGRRG